MLAADIATLSPAQDASSVPVDANLEIAFTETIQEGPGTRNIFVKNADDGSLIEAIHGGSDQVSIEGNALQIDLSDDLPENANILVEIDGAIVRDQSSGTGVVTLLSEDFEGLNLQDSPLATDDVIIDVNDYVVVMSGTLDVKVAGEYTFGINSDDGQQLAIDIEQDGLDLLDDEVIYDDSTHGNQDRLSTCGSDVQSCELDESDGAIELEVGEYEFEYWYFERGGGSSGEFYYAPGEFVSFAAGEFAVVGDDSKGIGVTEDGIEVTTYKSASVQIGTMAAAEDLVDGIDLADGFPVMETYEFADVYNTGGRGRFRADNPLPGFPPPTPGDNQDWTTEAPFGWTRDVSDMPQLPGDDGLEGTEDDVPPVEEYNGWTFMDKYFWVNQQGNQSRTDFTKGVGTVALVDPDAFDDFGLDIGDGAPPDSSTFDSSLSTPPISLAGVTENTAKVKFDSSWWDEDYQTAELTVEYFDDSGESLSENTLFRWESQQGEFYKAAARNETVEQDLENPANASSMIITWDMPAAGNDWWWAIDNIEVTAEATGNVSEPIDDWTFNTFAAPTISVLGSAVSEDGGAATITVRRQGADASAVSVSYATVPGTATSGDFTAANGTIEFAAGEVEKSFTISVIDDQLAETDETFEVALSNPTGGAILDENADAAVVTIIDNDRPVMVFQEGVEITVDGVSTGVVYEGTTDADPAGQSPDAVRNNDSLNPDGSDGGQPVHALTKFDNIFGDAAIPGPDEAVVTKATLTFEIFNEGTPLTIHRMLGDWDQEDITWEGLMLNGNSEPGLQGDGVEATESLGIFSTPAEVVDVDVTEQVKLWHTGEAENYGWGFLPTGTNGVDWHSAEATSPTTRPKLSIEYVIPTEDPGCVNCAVGDFNSDGLIDFADFITLSTNYNTSGDEVQPEDGDTNEDKSVDFTDFITLSTNYNKTVEEVTAPAAAAVDAIFGAA